MCVCVCMCVKTFAIIAYITKNMNCSYCAQKNFILILKLKIAK